MVKKIKVIWDDEAKKSFRSIYDYIKNRESLRVAKRVRTEILKQTKNIALFPEKFEQEPHLKMSQEIIITKSSGVIK